MIHAIDSSRGEAWTVYSWVQGFSIGLSRCNTPSCWFRIPYFRNNHLQWNCEDSVHELYNARNVCAG